jgi:hypothetical protein
MDSNGAKRVKLPGGGQSSKGGSDGGAPGDQEELDAQYEEEDEAGQKAATDEPMVRSAATSDLHAPCEYQSLIHQIVSLAALKKLALSQSRRLVLYSLKDLSSSSRRTSQRWKK